MIPAPGNQVVMATKTRLSIIIPVYNWNIGPLLEQLHSQCIDLGPDSGIEIIVVDDGSSQRFDNEEVASRLALVQYHGLSPNQGRAVARNTLITLAKGDYMLFLDADMLPDSNDFVRTYVALMQRDMPVVVGGLSYLQHKEAEVDAHFYIYKSQKTEAVEARLRQRSPWKYIFTSNILVKSSIVKEIGFDERFQGYGFEDVEWGLRLSKKYDVLHIDNTCSHMGIVTKKEMFERMRQSIANYALLLHLHPEEKDKFSIVAIAERLKPLPLWLLRMLDRCLVILFGRVPVHQLLYLLYQADKVLLLAIRGKEQHPFSKKIGDG